MNTRGFRHIRVGVNEVHGLGVHVGVKRTNIVLVPVNVQLRFCTVSTCVLAAKDLELLGRDRSVEVLNSVSHAEFLRGVAIGTGPVFGVKVVEIVRVADFGVVDVKPPDLVHHPGMFPVEQPAVFITFCWMFILEDFIRRQIIQFHQASARLCQVAELVFPHNVAALMDIVRRDRGVHVGRDVPVIRQIELKVVRGAVFGIRDQET